MKILLYGIGKELDNVENRIKEEHEIIGYMDSFSEINLYQGRVFYEVRKVKSLEFDYLIITVWDRKAAWSIQNWLVSDYGIPIEKIIPFWVYAKREIWEHKMKTCDLKNIKGMILGNSYALHGFLEKELDLPFVNLSARSQDLFYSYRVYSRCIEEYGDRLSSLEYIVLDLYDYMIFNVDISRTRYFLEYLYLGGLYETHNFKKNKNFSGSIKDELFRTYGIVLEEENQKRKIMDKIFDNANIQPNFFPNDLWGYIEKEAPVPLNAVLSSVIRKRFEDTITENKEIIVDFIKTIRNKNRDMKIVFTLIPKYISVEVAAEPFMQVWKAEFNDIITDLCAKYQILFWNYKGCGCISKNPRFYHDPRHLNTAGAKAMTAILNKNLQEI